MTRSLQCRMDHGRTTPKHSVVARADGEDTHTLVVCCWLLLVVVTTNQRSPKAHTHTHTHTPTNESEHNPNTIYLDIASTVVRGERERESESERGQHGQRQHHDPEPCPTSQTRQGNAVRTTEPNGAPFTSVCWSYMLRRLVGGCHYS
jgi:hypothetical protein